MYKPSKSVLKAVQPAAMIPVIAEAIHAAAPTAIDHDTAYQIATGVFALYTGLANWLKNRRK